REKAAPSKCHTRKPLPLFESLTWHAALIQTSLWLFATRVALHSHGMAPSGRKSSGRSTTVEGSVKRAHRSSEYAVGACAAPCASSHRPPSENSPPWGEAASARSGATRWKQGA